MLTLDDLTKAQSHHLGIDISLPTGWTQLPTIDGVVSIGGPVALGCRPLLTLAHEPFDPPSPQGFAAGVMAVRAAQPRHYDRFELVTERVTAVHDHACQLVTFRWQHPVGWLTQLLALVVVEPGLALQADGVCFTECEAAHLVDLEAIVLSIGFRG